MPETDKTSPGLLQLHFGPVTVRSGLIRAAILDAITPEIFLFRTHATIIIRLDVYIFTRQEMYGTRENYTVYFGNGNAKIVQYVFKD